MSGVWILKSPPSRTVTLLQRRAAANRRRVQVRPRLGPAGEGARAGRRRTERPTYRPPHRPPEGAGSAPGCLLLCWGPRAVVCTVVVHVIPEAPSVGQNVILSVEGVLDPLRHFDWYRGRLADGSTRIFSYFPGQELPQRNGVQFTGREVGFPNGSLLLRGAQANDSGTYQVALLLVPQASEKGTVELRVSAPVSTLGPRTLLPPGSGTGPPPATAAPSTPQVLGWVVAGVVVGILLTGALGAVVIYHLVLRRSDLARGSTGKLDPKGKKPQRSARDDMEPIYEVMESPLELPQPEGRNPKTDPQAPPAIPLPPQPDPNYTELLKRAESVYAQIQR
ncbi:carcinoembryonic antigen-related cell adhesion molecule 19 isoform X2 [Mauremys reevesii]|uniref:carcinoembryonic antigen-related cell adhesion molecule 19 isoform X2 n=1 Tax=Mauremys reevesii TaxID=260615 RepID=UPI00194003CA|nr:carcinoembryonic antigen-related cell adhesion molecule 19 isoform X2 [Mauremys reevesii]